MVTVDNQEKLLIMVGGALECFGAGYVLITMVKGVGNIVSWNTKA